MNNLIQTKRLQRYRMALMRLKNMGLKKTFSHSLSEETGVSPELIRKDFSKYGIKGKRRGGYDIDHLIEELKLLFGREKEQNVILVGLGNIGSALIKYEGYRQSNMNMVAAFDIDPLKRTRRYSVPVYSLENLREIIEAFDVSIAILAVPEFSAQETAQYLVDNGINGILNFAPVLLKLPGHVLVNNVNIMIELERLMYHTGVRPGSMYRRSG
jgi:redox-sensing transcriptional repressor